MIVSKSRTPQQFQLVVGIELATARAPPPPPYALWKAGLGVRERIRERNDQEDGLNILAAIMVGVRLGCAP